MNQKSSVMNVSGSYELFMLGLCILSLATVAFDTFFTLDKDTHLILGWADTFVCGLFFVDFLINLWRAPSRWRYFISWGWVDLLSSIPAIDILRWGRAARVFRIFRLLRAIRVTRYIARFIIVRRVESTFLAVSMLTLLLVVVSSIAILRFEIDAGSNIKDAGDAVWWTLTTLTTVGYGDLFPVTTWGRLVGGLVMVCGVGLFGAFSGFIASWLITPAQKNEQTDIDLLRQEIAELKQIMAESSRGPGNRDFSQAENRTSGPIDV